MTKNESDSVTQSLFQTYPVEELWREVLSLCLIFDLRHIAHELEMNGFEAFDDEVTDTLLFNSATFAFCSISGKGTLSFDFFIGCCSNTPSFEFLKCALHS